MLRGKTDRIFRPWNGQPHWRTRETNSHPDLLPMAFEWVPAIQWSQLFHVEAAALRHLGLRPISRPSKTFSVERRQGRVNQKGTRQGKRKAVGFAKTGITI